MPGALAFPLAGQFLFLWFGISRKAVPLGVLSRHHYFVDILFFPGPLVSVLTQQQLGHAQCPFSQKNVSFSNRDVVAEPYGQRSTAFVDCLFAFQK